MSDDTPQPTGDDALRQQTFLACSDTIREKLGHGDDLLAMMLADALMPSIREHVADLSKRLDRYQRLDLIHMHNQLRMIHAVGKALGIDQNDADACVPGCDEGAGGLEHDLHHLIERDAARGAVLRDIADHGLRADLNPTVPSLEHAESYGWWMNYLRRIDASVRQRARAALDGEATP